MTRVLGFAAAFTMFVQSAPLFAQEQDPALRGTVVVQPVVQPAPAPAVVVEPAHTPPVVVVQEDDRERNVVTTETHPNFALLYTGIVTLGISYSAAVIVGATSDRVEDDRLFIPLLGPWLDIGDRGTCRPVTNQACDESTVTTILLAADGVFQAVGALAILGGILLPTEEEVRTQARGFHLAPVSLAYGAPGIAAFGTF